MVVQECLTVCKRLRSHGNCCGLWLAVEEGGPRLTDHFAHGLHVLSWTSIQNNYLHSDLGHRLISHRLSAV